MIEWEQSPPITPMTWHEAMRYVQSLNTISESGWRLPTIQELKEALDNKVKGFKPDIYWSLNEYEERNVFVWTLSFYTENVFGYNKAYPYNVRCVREIK